MLTLLHTTDSLAALYDTPMRVSVIGKTLDPIGTANSLSNGTDKDFGEKVLPTITMKDAMVAKKEDSWWHRDSTRHIGGD
jgi:hypothetical protein